MSALRHLPAILLALGGTTVVAALVRWGVTFWPTVSNDDLSLAEAGGCLVAESSLCRLATSLCGARHAALVAAYSPLVLWSGATEAFGGLCGVPGRLAAESRIAKPSRTERPMKLLMDEPADLAGLDMILLREAGFDPEAEAGVGWMDTLLRLKRDFPRAEGSLA